MKNQKESDVSEHFENEHIEKIRHSCSHILAAAVKRLFPDTKLGIGPVIEEGFYYDFDTEHKFTPEDFAQIEKLMQEIINKDDKFERKELTAVEAKKLFKGEKYKLELIKELANQGEKISIYKTGDFTDLCAGPHVNSSKEIKAFKLMKAAGAYWKGSSENAQLQRIYGTAFESKQELDNYLKIIEEAEKRDHRKLGKQLDLFSFHEEAPGMPFFHDKGTFIFNKLVEFMTSEMRLLSYEINKTPIILNKQLWLQSGHWDHYKENMYFTKIDEQDYAVKPMNCPGNILVFKTKMHSYKELPIKAGEFGLVHRHELSGVLSGLFRVRVFTQDDAHVFCEEEQAEEQVVELLGLVNKIYSTFGFEYDTELSTKPLNSMGDPKKWEFAERILHDALKSNGIKYKINEGEGAFYGPKIDFHIKDAIGRKWQCGTIQLDFQMPEKFDLEYEGRDGKKHQPVMVHRAIYGSVERFMGILIEHYAGAFPVWISPVQVAIITVADRHVEFAEKLKKEMSELGIRVEIDARSESIGKKVRDNQMQKVPYVIVVGDKEVSSAEIAVRARDNKVTNYKRQDFINKVLEEIKNRSA